MNHYELLGVPRDVSMEELRRAYRKLAREHHPDRHGDDTAAATARMVAINEAFAVLRDPVRRFDYNRSLERSTPTPRSFTGAASTTAATPPTSQAPAEAQPSVDDDPVRRARREAKERAAAEAKARGYRDPTAGRMSFRSRRRRRR